MKPFSNPLNLPIILLFTIIGLMLILIITFFVENAKKKTSLNLLYVLVAGIFLGLVGIRTSGINNLFYFYLIILIWNLIAGSLHVFLSGKFLEWPKSEPMGWRFLFELAIVMIGFSVMLSFMKLFSYQMPSDFVFYYLSAVLTFFIPLTLVYVFECYSAIPTRIFLQHPWIYHKGPELEWDQNQDFVIIKYKLTTQKGGSMIESLPMNAPQDLRLGDFFNSTLEYFKVTQDRYEIEVRDRSNNPLGWYFFIDDGSPMGKFIDPNKTFLELGFKNNFRFGQVDENEMQNITNRYISQGKSYTIICKREKEHKSQLLKS